jgi:hypothetical protein
MAGDMSDQTIEHHELVRIDDGGALCMDCGITIPEHTFAARRLEGVTGEGDAITDKICLACITLNARFALLTVTRDDEGE